MFIFETEKMAYIFAFVEIVDMVGSFHAKTCFFVNQEIQIFLLQMTLGSAFFNIQHIYMYL